MQQVGLDLVAEGDFKLPILLTLPQQVLGLQARATPGFNVVQVNKLQC